MVVVECLYLILRLDEAEICEQVIRHSDEPRSARSQAGSSFADLLCNTTAIMNQHNIHHRSMMYVIWTVHSPLGCVMYLLFSGLYTLGK